MTLTPFHTRFTPFVYILYLTTQTNASSLSNTERQNIRKAGRCVKGCGFGYTNTPIAPTNSNAKFKNIHVFESLLSSYTTLETQYDNYTKTTTSSEKTTARPNNFGLNNKYHLTTLFHYCNSLHESFEYCMTHTKHILLYEQAYECYTSCMAKSSKDDAEEIPFEGSAFAQQGLERCLDGFESQDVFFDFEDLSSSTSTSTLKEKMMEQYESNGFVIIENVLKEEEDLMKNVTNVLNAWRKLKTWGGLNFTRYSYDEYIVTNANRLEVILPYKDPFKTLISKLKTTLDLPLFSKEKAINLISASASIPGAIQQNKYRNSSSNSKDTTQTILQIIPHDSHIPNGIVSFCPCTHHHAHSMHFYKMEHQCPLPQTPELKAGSLVVYDGALLHYDNRNYGGIVRWNLEVRFGGVEGLLPFRDEEVLRHVEEYRHM